MPIVTYHRREVLLLKDDDSTHRHERRTLACLPDDVLLVCSPHLDVHEEEISWYSQIHLPGPRGGLPAKWYAPERRGKYVMFTPAALLQLEPILRQHEQDYTSHQYASTRLAEVDGDTVAGEARGSADAAPIVDRFGPDDAWLHTESRDGYQLGTSVDLCKDVAVRMGDRGIRKLGGLSLCIGLTGTLDTPAASLQDGTADVMDDLRTLTIVYDKRGRRRRVFTDAVLACYSTTFAGFKISGPPKLLVGADDSEGGVDEHEFLTTLAETTLTYDNLNLSELAMGEAISRRFMLWDQFRAEWFSDTVRRIQGGMDVEERDAFFGHRRSDNRSLVAPVIEARVNELLREPSAIRKERRDAREKRRQQADDKAVEGDGKERGRDKGGGKKN